MYSHVATGAAVAAIPASAVASGFAPAHIAVIVGGSAAGMAGLVGLVRFAHRAARPRGSRARGRRPPSRGGGRRSIGSSRPPRCSFRSSLLGSCEHTLGVSVLGGALFVVLATKLLIARRVRNEQTYAISGD